MLSKYFYTNQWRYTQGPILLLDKITNAWSIYKFSLHHVKVTKSTIFQKIGHIYFIISLYLLVFDEQNSINYKKLIKAFV